MEKKILITIILLVLISLSINFVSYPMLPNIVPSHWNSAGEIDSYAPKEFNLVLFSGVIILLAGLFYVIPKIEPKKKNIEKFEKSFDLFAVAIISFFTYMNFLITLISLGYDLNFTKYFVPAFGILFFIIGVMLKQAKQNYTIGIRTPWTLASETVWDKTHKKGSMLFKLSGIITLLSVFVPEYAFYFLIGPVLTSVLVLFVYSYYLYSKEKK